MSEKISFKIRRRLSASTEGYWDFYQIPFKPRMTVIDALREIQKNPVNWESKAVCPVVWESACESGDCGACAMLVNGKVTLACSARLETSGKPVTLEPLSKFPVVRDLWVDRSRTETDLARSIPWAPIDFARDDSPYTSFNLPQVRSLQALERCIQCGACLEACPQYNDRSSFIGAAAIARARAAQAQENGNRPKRLEVLMDKGGIEDCGNAQNCQKVCPTQVPLLNSIAHTGREVTQHALGRLLGKE